MYEQFLAKSNIFNFSVLVLEIATDHKTVTFIMVRLSIFKSAIVISWLWFLPSKVRYKNLCIVIIPNETFKLKTYDCELIFSLIEQFLFADMETLDRGDSFKYHRSRIEQWFKKWNVEMHTHWIALCSRKYGWQTNHGYHCAHA